MIHFRMTDIVKVKIRNILLVERVYQPLFLCQIFQQLIPSNRYFNTKTFNTIDKNISEYYPTKTEILSSVI